jgi:hypothetical protein
MRKLFFVLVSLYIASSSLYAGKGENELNESAIVQKHIQEQLEREKKYAREKAFYQGSEYNLDETKVDESTVKAIPVIKPEDDFDMDEVYSDIQ